MTHPLQHQLGVMAREHPERTSQPHKCHGHLEPARTSCACRAISWIALGGKLRERWERKRTTSWAGSASRPIGWRSRVEALQHTYGLKEVKPVPFLKEDSL